MRITKVLPKEDFTLHIEADEGRSGLFDVKPYLESEAFAPLKDQREFIRIRNGGYYIEWECGADFSADTIEARSRWTPGTAENAQQGALQPAPKNGRG
jgi:Protein of unknown function (DUF2442)